MYDEFRDRLMVYSGDPLTKILKRGEGYESVKTLYVISILDGFLKVNGEDKPLKDKLLRRAYLRMDEGSKILSDKLNFIFAVTCGKLFDAADRNNVEQRKLSIYDRMERDAIQIEAEKRYAVREALAEGEAKGEARGKVEIAKAMLADKIDTATISKYTGLSEEGIKAL